MDGQMDMDGHGWIVIDESALMYGLIWMGICMHL